MKILIVSPSLKLGGIERALTVLANEWANRDLQVTYVSCLKHNPFYKLDSNIKLIERSLEQLVKLADNNPQWKIILVPRVGCGAGELDYKDIKPLMEKYLDDRFICCSFK